MPPLAFLRECSRKRLVAVARAERRVNELDGPKHQHRQEGLVGLLLDESNRWVGTLSDLWAREPETDHICCAARCLGPALPGVIAHRLGHWHAAARRAHLRMEVGSA